MNTITSLSGKIREGLHKMKKRLPPVNLEKVNHIHDKNVPSLSAALNEEDGLDFQILSENETQGKYATLESAAIDPLFVRLVSSILMHIRHKKGSEPYLQKAFEYQGKEMTFWETKFLPKLFASDNEIVSLINRNIYYGMARRKLSDVDTDPKAPDEIKKSLEKIFGQSQVGEAMRLPSVFRDESGKISSSQFVKMLIERYKNKEDIKMQELKETVGKFITKILETEYLSNGDKHDIMKDDALKSMFYEAYKTCNMGGLFFDELRKVLKANGYDVSRPAIDYFDTENSDPYLDITHVENHKTKKWIKDVVHPMILKILSQVPTDGDESYNIMENDTLRSLILAGYQQLNYNSNFFGELLESFENKGYSVSMPAIQYFREDKPVNAFINIKKIR